jgi:hypothetical protein
MIELSNAEALDLTSLLIRIGRPHSPDDARAMEQWVVRLSRGRRVDIHGGDLLA